MKRLVLLMVVFAAPLYAGSIDNLANFEENTMQALKWSHNNSYDLDTMIVDTWYYTKPVRNLNGDKISLLMELVCTDDSLNNYVIYINGHWNETSPRVPLRKDGCTAATTVMDSLLVRVADSEDDASNNRYVTFLLTGWEPPFISFTIKSDDYATASGKVYMAKNLDAK